MQQLSPATLYSIKKYQIKYSGDNTSMTIKIGSQYDGRAFSLSNSI